MVNLVTKFNIGNILVNFVNPSSYNEFLYCLRNWNTSLFLKIKLSNYLFTIRRDYPVCFSNFFYLNPTYFHFIYLCIKIAEVLSWLLQKPNLINCIGVRDFSCRTEAS